MSEQCDKQLTQKKKKKDRFGGGRDNEFSSVQFRVPVGYPDGEYSVAA